MPGDEAFQSLGRFNSSESKGQADKSADLSAHVSSLMQSRCGP